VAFRNSDKHEPSQRNSQEVSDLTFSDSFVGFRPFTFVFRFFQRNDTRNVTRRENPPGLSRRNTYACLSRSRPATVLSLGYLRDPVREITDKPPIN